MFPYICSESVTWFEVQQKLVAAQAEHMMCIHKQELTPLDIYHRILRWHFCLCFVEPTCFNTFCQMSKRIVNVNQ